MTLVAVKHQQCTSPYILKCIAVNRFSLALAIFCVASSYRLQAQGPVEVMNQLSPETWQKTPNVAAMEKLGDHPVNLYTGRSDISATLQTMVLKNRDFD